MSNEEETLQILLATDCHLGYMESDAVRGSDSLNTFEEILKIGVEKEVDFLLLGGDLFHENKPSRKILHDCISLLRKYCMGDRPVQFEFLSDQSVNFKHSTHPIVNFEDPNLNVSIPVFSIHGNHDDPAGAGCLCSLDLLSATGLVNYFGKSTDLQKIDVSPLMFQKGKTKLCLYGLGSIRDERLHRMFLEGNVKMLRPRENYDEWFNLMVLHQNRTKHGAKNYIPEQFLDNFLDLVVWGHEHECRIDPEENVEQAFFVTQPGSSVATSLCHGEAVPKHVGLLQIRQKEFQITKIPLKTVRQFYIKDVDLQETELPLSDPDSKERVADYCQELVDQYIEKAEQDFSGHPKQPKLPLVRLRVFCPPNFETFSVQRFGHSYVSKVANSKDIILFSRKKSEKLKSTEIDSEMLKTILKREGFDKQRVEDLVKKYFEQADDKKRLLVLSEVGVSSAVQEYVDKDVKESISSLVNHQVEKTQAHLEDASIDHTLIDSEIVKFREERQKNAQTEVVNIQALISKKNPTVRHNSNDFDDNMFDEETVEIPTTKTRGKGRGRGRGRGRGAANKNESLSAPSKRTSSRASSKREVAESPVKRKSRQTNLSSFLSTTNGNTNIQEIDLSDDEEIVIQPKRRKVTQTSAPSRSKRGIVFDISDSD